MSYRHISEITVREAERLYVQEKKSCTSISQQVDASRSTIYRWVKKNQWMVKKEIKKDALVQVQNLLHDLVLEWIRVLRKLDITDLNDRKFITFFLTNVEKVFKLEKLYYKNLFGDVVRTMDLFVNHNMTLNLSEEQRNALIICVDGFFNHIKENYAWVRG